MQSGYLTSQLGAPPRRLPAWSPFLPLVSIALLLLPNSASPFPLLHFSLYCRRVLAPSSFRKWLPAKIRSNPIHSSVCYSGWSSCTRGLFYSGVLASCYLENPDIRFARGTVGWGRIAGKIDNSVYSILRNHQCM